MLYALTGGGDGVEADSSSVQLDAETNPWLPSSVSIRIIGIPVNVTLLIC